MNPAELAPHYDAFPDAVLVHCGGIWTYANPVAAEMLGFDKPAELIGRPIVESVPPEERATVLRRANNAARGERNPVLRQRLIRRDGTAIDVEVAGQPVSASGRPSPVLIVVRDVSDRLAEERRFQNTFEQVAVGIAHVSLEGRWILVNRRFAQIVGHEYDRLLQQTFRDITHPEDRPADELYIGRMVAGEVPTFSMEKRCIGGEGQIIWVHLTVSLARDRNGAPEYFIIVATDITQQKIAENALRASEERMRHLVEYAGELLVVIDENGDIQYTSPAVTRLLGYEIASLIGQSVFAFIHPDDLPEQVGRFKRMAATPGLREIATMRVRSANEGWRIYGATVVNMLHDPSVGGIVINAQDRTEPIRLTEELAELRRVESLGRVAASVAHEFNNVLAAADTFATVLERKLKGDEIEFVRGVRDAVRRGKQIVTQILRYGHPATVVRQQFDVATWLADVHRELEPLLPHNPLIVDVADGVTTITGDRQQLTQVMVNLVLNARDASPAGAPVTIAALREDGGAARLEVRDCGPGIPPREIDRLFEPLYTTKRNGTGLGLAVVQQIIVRHGGTVSVSSEAGKGSTFAAVLP